MLLPAQVDVLSICILLILNQQLINQINRVIPNTAFRQVNVEQKTILFQS